MKTAEKTITASEFKAKCLKILEELDPSGIIITKRGRPVAKVTPIQSEDNLKLIGSMKGKIKIKGNLFSTGIRLHACSIMTPISQSLCSLETCPTENFD